MKRRNVSIDKSSLIDPNVNTSLKRHIVALPFVQSCLCSVLCLIVTIAGLHAKESLLTYTGLLLCFASVIISFWQFSKLHRQ